MLLVSVVVAALGLAFAGPASAQTPFQATVQATTTRSTPPCSNGAFICGAANIAGYGAASWNFYVLGYTDVDSPCGSTYQAVTEFTLASDPASTLVLDEAGNLCGLGHDGAGYRGYFAGGPNDYGHPYAIDGSWTVDPASTGEFAGLTGAGTDVINVAGAHAGGSYSGTLG